MKKAKKNEFLKLSREETDLVHEALLTQLDAQIYERERVKVYMPSPAAYADISAGIRATRKLLRKIDKAQS